jgi:hypothetical protein
VTTAYQMWKLRWFYMRALLADGSMVPSKGD